jgi:hypothetical protein
MNTPNAYTSVAVLLLPPENSSGAHHASVMAAFPPAAADAEEAMEVRSWTAPPKSHNLAVPLWLRSTFKLLMSPWTMPHACK